MIDGGWWEFAFTYKGLSFGFFVGKIYTFQIYIFLLHRIFLWTQKTVKYLFFNIISLGEIKPLYSWKYNSLGKLLEFNTF